MRVLLVHNSYQYSGGEDRAVAADVALLVSRGHEVQLYRRTYEEFARARGLSRLGAAAEAAWSRFTYARLRRRIREWRPDVAHFHNIFPLVTTSAYDACRAERVAVVQTLHNYRPLCAPGTLLRDGKPCELCVGRMPWPAVRYRCYRGSRTQSLAMAAALGGHAAIGTWTNKVDAYIALTHFGRRIFERGGLPADRIFVRPNAVEMPDTVDYRGPRSAIFVGRLSPEKGVGTIIDAWKQIPDIPLRVVGDGPLLQASRERAADLPHVEFLGQVAHAEALALIRSAGMLVFPSIWYEGLPYVVLEALAAGVPVVATDLGAQGEVVVHGINGLLFRPGDAGSLVAAVRRLLASQSLARALSNGARGSFRDRYSVEVSYRGLLDIYERVTA